MNPILEVPHYQQSAEGYCLPACARMVLAYLGLERTEAEIAKVLGKGFEKASLIWSLSGQAFAHLSFRRRRNLVCEARDSSFVGMTLEKCPGITACVQPEKLNP